VVDERRKSDERLQQTLRLAAAGEMAGAIAHELNQPLTALANYSHAAQMLIVPSPDPRLGGILARILLEADRAADVVRRLRDLFRSGTTRLEEVPVGELLQAAQRIGRAAIGEARIRLEVGAEAQLPRLYVDRLQVEVVLRNLLANAVESILGAHAASGDIRIFARRHTGQQVCITVQDSGPGIGPEARATLFQPFVSGKPTGMGLGLAVSRAIAEAHGGSLAASADGRGEFALVLPCLPAP
jgi:C4-dicarboxylate-specific signal transduction histidine kinase